MRKLGLFVALTGASAPILWTQFAGAAPLPEGVTRVPVRIVGGHETNPRDNGRPVVLIAAALGVPSDVFREAFSHVNPAPGGERPNPDDVRANKDALLSKLAPYGVTNERLDEVSDYYRYRPQNGELWSHQDAKIFALVKNGKITKFEIESAGSGYSSLPGLILPEDRLGLPLKLSFSKDLERNGALEIVSLAPAKKPE